MKKNEFLISKDQLISKCQIPYPRHYNPRFVYFYPLFEGKTFFQKILPLCMVSIQERFVIKSGL